jgi:two-component system CheB/CheR fusion protein
LKSSKDISAFTEDIINAVQDPLIILDKDLRVVKASQSFCDFFKVTSDEINGTLIYDFGNHQWNIPELIGLLGTILPGNTSFDNFEVELDFPAIGKRIMLLNARKILSRSGEDQLIHLNIEDITQRKHAEEEHHKNEKQLRIDYHYARSLFEVSLDPLVTINSNGKITDANSATEKVVGVSRDSLIGSDFSSYFTEPYKAQIGYQKIFEQGFVVGYPLTIRHTSNKLIDVLFNASIYRDNENKILGIFATAHDITERNKAEKEIKLINDQLVLLNSEKDKFFSIIAHDLKSPFQGLLGLTDIMVQEESGYSAEEWSQMGSDLHRIATNLFSLLKNLLEWAQMQKGSIPFQPKEILLSDLIEEIVETLKKRSEQKGISIVNSVSNHVYAYADGNMIKSVLINLISNAVKFTPRNGQVTITADNTASEMIKISVADTGVGMQLSEVDKLFKIGEKIGKIGTDGELSTGLGLLLCKEFVEKQGGQIFVESEKGKGSIFSFTVPVGELV